MISTPVEWFGGILLFLTLLMLFEQEAQGAAFLLPTHSNQPTRQRPSFFVRQLQAYLTSALETCTPIDVESGKPLIQWIDLAMESSRTERSAGDGADDTEEGSSESTLLRMPLYPLSSAVYLPRSDDAPAVNRTLRNTELRNIQMALDLEENITKNGRFCAVLRAVDTGRLANVGTVLRVVAMEKQYHSSKSTAADDDSSGLKRVIVTCTPEEIVDIERVENPDSAKLEYRLRQPREYLHARVRPRIRCVEQESDETKNLINLYRCIQEDYNTVRNLYLDGVGTEDLPPFSVGRLSEVLTLMTLTNLTTPTKFWEVADVWQTLCETVREGRQMVLSSDRNELLVEAAIRKGGGPLKLPIHVEDLLKEDRKQVEELELRSNQQWREMKLDPCMDFQVLLSLNSHVERLEYFSRMVARERQRLEALVAAESSHRQRQDGQFNSTAAAAVVERTHPEPPRKGAWFDDDW